MAKKVSEDKRDGLSDILTGIEKTANALVSDVKRDKASMAAATQLALIDALSRRGAELESMIRLLSEQRAALEQRVSVEYLEFESRLRESFAQRQWRVDGQWPTLYVERAVEIKADDAKRSVSVDGTVVECHVPAVVAAVGSLVEDLVPPSFKPETFLRQLAEAYDAIRGRPRQAPIWDVYRAVVINMQNKNFWRDVKRERFVPLTANQFRARLSRLLSAQVTCLADGRQLRLLPPLNPKDAMYIFQPAEGRFGYVGRIEFLGGAA